jgi:hypothetical protein
MIQDKFWNQKICSGNISEIRKGRNIYGKTGKSTEYNRDFTKI